MLIWQWFHVRDDGPISTMTGMVRVDGFGVYLGILVVIATALALLVSVAYLQREQLEAPEYLALVLFSGARHGHHDHREQPDRRVPRARGPVDPAVRAEPPSTVAG